jgi:hypothetical protein
LGAAGAGADWKAGAATGGGFVGGIAVGGSIVDVGAGAGVDVGVFASGVGVGTLGGAVATMAESVESAITVAVAGVGS